MFIFRIYENEKLKTVQTFDSKISADHIGISIAMLLSHNIANHIVVIAVALSLGEDLQ